MIMHASAERESWRQVAFNLVRDLQPVTSEEILFIAALKGQEEKIVNAMTSLAALKAIEKSGRTDCAVCGRSKEAWVVSRAHKSRWKST